MAKEKSIKTLLVISPLKILTVTKFRIIIIFVILISLALRTAFLNADPSILLDSGQVGDEGYWLYNARSLALFGKTAPDDFYSDLAAVPIFSFFSFISFLIFGVGFWQARIVSAMAGLISVVITYKIGGLFGKKIALMSAFLVSVNTLLLLHNRLAVGESIQIAFANASLYFFLIKKPIHSGALFAAALLAKTTAILYIPSFVLLNIVEVLKNKRRFYSAFRFSFAFFAVFLMVTVPIIYIWGDKVFLIYSTFGEWLKPNSFRELFNNISNFSIHPFWGSPFNFSLAILSLLNILNFFTSSKTNNENRKLLIFWALGIIILGPLISRITNARLLPTIVPMAILSSQVLVYGSYAVINFPFFYKNLVRRNYFEKFFLLLCLLPVSYIVSKIILAVTKRVLVDESIVSFLPQLMFMLLPVLVFLTFVFKKKLRKNLLMFGFVFLMSLPLLAFIGVFIDYLAFFSGGTKLPTTITSFIALIFLGFSYFYVTRIKFNFNRIKRPLIYLYLSFNFFGILTIFVNPSYRLLEGSRTFGEIAKNSAVIGFYGHELSLENKIKPIYWAPRLARVNRVNSNYKNYNPEYILEVQTFDLPILKPDPWPNTTDVKVSKKMTTLDLSRQFLGAKRDFKLDIYQLNN